MDGIICGPCIVPSFVCVVILGSKLVSSRTRCPLEPDAIHSVLATDGLIVLQQSAMGGLGCLRPCFLYSLGLPDRSMLQRPL